MNSRAENRRNRNVRKRNEAARRGKLLGTKPKKKISGNSQEVRISPEPKYGALAKKRKHTNRVKARIIKTAINGQVGSTMRNAYLDRVILPLMQKPIMDGKKAVEKQFSKKILREAFAEHRKTGEIILPKSFEHIVLGMAIRRAFASIGLPDKSKRQEAIKVVQHLHKTGKISFAKNTHAVFTKSTIRKVSEQLGPKANEFIQNFKQYLKDETGQVREYIHLKGQGTIRHEWKWAGEFQGRQQIKKSANDK